MVEGCPASGLFSAVPQRRYVRLMRAKEASENLKENRRSLHYATPDFLWKLVALANIMRLSSKKGAHAVLSSAAWQEIRVRSG
jgi:hypothetical protein